MSNPNEFPPPNMALQRTRRPRIRSGRSLCSLGSPLSFWSLGAKRGMAGGAAVWRPRRAASGIAGGSACVSTQSEADKGCAAGGSIRCGPYQHGWHRGRPAAEVAVRLERVKQERRVVNRGVGNMVLA